MKENKAEIKYNILLPKRQILEKTWEICSQLTLPYIYSGESSSDKKTSALYVPYNTVGASSVNNLSSKLMINLLSPTKQFFRLLPDEEKYNQLDEDQKRELEKQLISIENIILETIETDALRIPVSEALKHLIVTGNSLMYKTKNSMKVFSVYDYVVERDFSNNLLNAVIKETISENILSEDLKKNIDEEYIKEGQVELYTLIERVEKNKYKVTQHIGSFEFNEKYYTKEKLPYIVLRFNTINNSEYGIGLVEQYLGDLKSLEILTKSITDITELMSKLVLGKKPGTGMVDIKDLENALINGNGKVILGDLEKDITTLQFNKVGDLQIAYNLIQKLEMKIGKAFLNFNDTVRDAERVTAAEIRANALELETSLGGVFSVLTQELQIPLLTLILDEINPKALKSVSLSVSSGLNSISKEKDYQNLNVFLQSIAQFGPEIIGQYLDMPAYFAEVANALGIDGNKILKSNEQIQAEQQAKQEAIAQEQQMQASQQINQEVNKIK